LLLRFPLAYAPLFLFLGSLFFLPALVRDLLLTALLLSAALFLLLFFVHALKLSLVFPDFLIEGLHSLSLCLFSFVSLFLS
jgi:hypothetical protein